VGGGGYNTVDRQMCLTAGAKKKEEEMHLKPAVGAM